MEKNALIGVLVIVFVAAILALSIGYVSRYLSGQEKIGVAGFGCTEEFKYALDALDPSLCLSAIETASVKNPYYDNICKELCMQEIASAKRDPSLCKTISSFKDIPHVEGWDDPRLTGSVRDHCVFQAGRDSNDISLCNELETEWAKSNCESMFKQ